MTPSHSFPGEQIVATLPDDLLSDLFNQVVLPDWYLPRLPATAMSERRAIVIGGQPGAGKTAARNLWAPTQDFAAVNGDDMRSFHPQFVEIVRRHPERMADLTAGISGQLVAASIAWFIDHRFSLTWETTFRSGDALVRDLARALSAGYGVEVRALAVPSPVSLEATVARWAAEVQSKGVGRPVSLAGHDKPFDAAPEVLSRIEEQLPGVSLYVVDRNGNVLHAPGVAGSAASMLAAGRHLTPSMASELRSRVKSTKTTVLSLPTRTGRESALEVLRTVDERIGRGTGTPTPRPVRRGAPRSYDDGHGM